MISGSWDHNSSHNGSNVEGRPDGHEFLDQVLFLEVGIASLVHSFLHWDSTGVVEGIWVVSVVVCLDDEPVCLAELVESVDGEGVSFDHAAFVGSHS